MSLIGPEMVEGDLHDASLDFKWEICPLGYCPHNPSIAFDSPLDNISSDLHEF